MPNLNIKLAKLTVSAVYGLRHLAMVCGIWLWSMVDISMKLQTMKMIEKESWFCSYVEKLLGVQVQARSIFIEQYNPIGIARPLRAVLFLDLDQIQRN